ncbi:CbtB domain-containing protein [Salinisphaera japonica]|uniref:Cobalt transporter n=1 Tax=Salinisphaera japonica YTM-1 TaxID=1209778 RepID=A0A423PFD4_9GAMM|nr:CbtB domain-containing protein [Salinisphaera japonica]ROO24349.1 cobalt transporter [Salinisphaera japonica YTM-1]
MSTTATTTHAPSTPAQSATRQMAQLGGAALIGLFIVYGVGFSHIMPVHNAAHDVRHSAVFPCH